MRRQWAARRPERDALLNGAVDATHSLGWLADERSVLIGNQAVHLRAGALTAYDW